jgi:hypothetical protein
MENESIVFIIYLSYVYACRKMRPLFILRTESKDVKVHKDVATTFIKLYSNLCLKIQKKNISPYNNSDCFSFSDRLHIDRLTVIRPTAWMSSRLAALVACSVTKNCKCLGLGSHNHVGK